MEDSQDEKRFISMLSDYGFKVAFGNEQHKNFLKRALQALIASKTPIADVSLAKNEIAGLTKDARGGLFDMICIDEMGREFIVEMQLFDYKYMIHRAKFYAFHRFNIMVKQGRYRFDDLRQIYTISFLAGKTYGTELYHQIGMLKNQQGELMDDQITHVVVKLGKFQKTLQEIKTDLDKLLYTMKLTDTATKSAQLPNFWKEGWLDEALKELDKANLTPEQRATYEMIVAGNMTEVVAKEEEWKAREKSVEEATRNKTKEEAIVKMIKSGALSDNQIADFQGVTTNEVSKIREKIKNSK